MSLLVDMKFIILDDELNTERNTQAYLGFHKLGGDVLAGRHEVHGQVAGAVLDLHILRHQNLLQDLQPGRHLPKHTARLVTLEPPICRNRFLPILPSNKKSRASQLSVWQYIRNSC